MYFFKENLFHFNLMFKFNALPITYYVPHTYIHIYITTI